ncbi:MAG: FAD-dependent thymidylate synthase [Candidatus Bilamarchaeaceae archaeon]
MVKLVSMTKPIEHSHLSPEELIVYVARVSNPSNQLNTATAPKLIRYCMEHGHWSVFEHVYVTFEVHTTRAIAAQMLRHRSMTFQEYSGRYAISQDADVNIEARLQDNKNRQNSLPTEDEELKQWFFSAQRQVAELSRKLYEEALSKGIAKEQARFLLPLSTKTTLYVTGNLRSWIHYIQLRAHPATQKEHRKIAMEIAHILSFHFPTIAQAAGWNKLQKDAT